MLEQHILDRLILYFPQQLLLILSLPWSLTSQHLIEYHPQSPNISLQSILIPPQRLGRHIQRRSHIVLTRFSSITNLDGKPKISDLDLTITHQDIGRLKITMYDILPCEIEIASNDLPHTRGGLLLGEPLLYLFAKIRITQLRDDIGVILGGEDIVEGEDVRLCFELLEHLDFAVEEDAIDFVLEHLEVDHLDGHILAVLIVATSVDVA